MYSGVKRNTSSIKIKVQDLEVWMLEKKELFSSQTSLSGSLVRLWVTLRGKFIVSVDYRDEVETLSMFEAVEKFNEYLRT